MGAYDDGRAGQVYVLADYQRQYTRSGAKLWFPVGLMDDREHDDTSVSRICVG